MDDKSFDTWSKTYDEDLNANYAEERYPFAAYDEIKSSIFQIAMDSKAQKILDLGIGTGNMSKDLYDQGLEIYGLDFSNEMLKKARETMPEARLYLGDFSQGLPDDLKDMKFSIIIIGYSIHHLNYDKQIELLEEILNNLDPGGKIIIGDVMTLDQKEMDKARERDIDFWDDSEYYMVFENLEGVLENTSKEFIKKSYCSGIIVIEKLL